MNTLRQNLIRLAHEKPELRRYLLPVIRQSGRLTASQPRYVVVDESTLGVLMSPDSIQVLATRVSHIDSPGIMPVPLRKIECEMPPRKISSDSG